MLHFASFPQILQPCHCVCLLDSVERNDQTLPGRDAGSEALGALPLLRLEFLGIRGCGLSAPTAQKQLQLWAGGDALPDPAAAQEVLQSSRD